MEDRGFSELDLRGMLDRARGIGADIERGRWLVETRHYRTERVEPGLVIDFDRRGRPIGIEITAPTKVSLAMPNRVLRKLGAPTMRRADIAPLVAA
jgi:hypothetical protein